MGDRSFVGHARTIGLLTLLSRVFGLVRDILSAHFFGAGLLWDAFTYAFRIPNLFRRLFGEGALTAAFVPAFVSRWDGGKSEEARTLFNRIITRLSLLLFTIVLLGIAVTSVLPLLFSSEKFALTSEMARIMMPYLFFICVAAILAATLQSLRHFAMPAFTPVLLNIVFIGALFISGGDDVRIIAYAVLVGGVLQVGVLWIPLLKRGIRYRPEFKENAGVREVRSGFLPVVFGLALVQINELLDITIAELCIKGHGAVSILGYGGQLNNLPLSLIGVSIGTAVFPALSSPNSDVGGLVQRALKGVFFLAIPATVGLIVFSSEIVALLFEHGKFGPDDTVRTAWVLRLYVVGLCFYCANHIQVRAFYALKDTRTPVRVMSGMVFVNLALNLILVWPFQEVGIAAATAISGLGSFVILTILLKKRRPDFHFSPLFRTAGLSILAASVMGAAAWAVHRWFLVPTLPGSSLPAEAGRVLIPVVFAVLLYFLIARLLRMEEVRQVLQRRRPSS